MSRVEEQAQPVAEAVHRPGILRRVDGSGVPMLLARVVVGGAMIYLALNKLAALADFHKALRSYEILPLDPPQLINAVAIYLPGLELVLGLAVLAGLALRGSFLTTFTMLVAFTVAVYFRGAGIQAEKGLEFCQVVFDCGCGTGKVNLCWKLFENSGLILLSGIGLLSSYRGYALRFRRR